MKAKVITSAPDEKAEVEEETSTSVFNKLSESTAMLANI